MASTPKPALTISGSPSLGPILLRARTRSIVGEVRVTNQSDETVMLQNAELRFASERRAAPLSELSAYVARPLLPRRTEVIRLRFRGQLPPSGAHRAELQVGGARCAATVNVPERIRLRLVPTVVFFPIGRARTIETEVLVVNRGNTAVNLSPFRVAAQLTPDDLECRALRRAFNSIDDEPASIEQVVGQIARAVRDVLKEPGILRVENRSAEIDLAPGETGALSLRLTRPAHSPKGVRCSASIPLYNTQLQVLLVPTGHGGEEVENS